MLGINKKSRIIIFITLLVLVSGSIVIFNYKKNNQPITYQMPAANFPAQRSLRLYFPKQTFEQVIGRKTAQAAVKLINPYNEEVTDNFGVSWDSSGDNISLGLSSRTSAFRAGKYQVTLFDKDDPDRKIVQDFLWGVLAINTNKSIYDVGDEIKFSIGILNEKGKMVCDAQATLRAVLPDGSEQILSTNDNTIIINPECQVHDVTYRPDYEASMVATMPGRYKLTLSAVSPNGQYQISDFIEVVDSAPFAIERETATRIFPLRPYTVNIDVVAHEDFAGYAVEKMSEYFKVEQLEKVSVDFEEIVVNGDRYLVWPVSIATGEKLEFKYIYNAPQISPEFYLLGPLRLISSDCDIVNDKSCLANDSQTVFSELRQWQIASDSVITYQQGDGKGTPSDTDDTYIGTSYPDTNYGTAITCEVDTSSNHKHCFIKFPNIFGSGADQIPLGSTINSATTTLYVDNITDVNPTVYQVTEAWSESQATWNNRLTGTAWSDTGGDGTTSHKATSEGDFPCTSTGYYDLAVTTSVQDWSNGAINEGWIFTDNSTDGCDFRSSEATTAANRPKLTVDYTTSGNSAPTITSVSDSPDPVAAGADVSFTVDWNDADAGDMVKAHICKTDAISGAACTGGSWCDSPVFTNRDPEICTGTTAAGDASSTPYTYYVFVCDDSNACSSSTSSTFSITQQAPSAPTALLTENLQSPAYNISTTTPRFSAVFNDPNPNDYMKKYCIQVNTAADFTGTNMWYSDSNSCINGTLTSQRQLASGTQLFSANAETGDTSQWTSVTTSTGNTFTAETEAKKDGSYGFKAYSSGNANAFGEYNITDVDEGYFKTDVYISSASTLAGGTWSNGDIGSFYQSSWNLVRWGVSSGATSAPYRWHLCSDYTTTNFSMDAWHEVEIYYKKGTGANSVCRAWVDGALLSDETNGDGTKQALTVRLGMGISGTWGSGSVIYFDNAIASTARVGTDWWDTRWTKRRKITFDTTSSATTTDLTDFPAAIQLNSSRIDYSQTQNSGQDIRFVDADYTALNYEIEKWDETGTSTVWVKVPTITANTSTDYIWMYYGNPTATDNSTTTGVWDDNYVMVRHYAETSSSYLDSTKNHNDTTNFEPSTASGKLGRAVSDTNTSLSVADDPTLDGMSQLTLEAWVNLNYMYDDDTIISKSHSVSPWDSYKIKVDTSAKVVFEVRDSGGGWNGSTGSTALATSTWYYISGVYNGSKIYVYVNAVSDDLSPDSMSGVVFDSNNVLYSPGWDYPDGTFDEFRISNTARSLDWLEFSYCNMDDRCTTYGSEEAQYTSAQDGERSEDITYAGTALSLNGTTYYWRMWFWDDSDNKSATSTTASFTMASGAADLPRGVRWQGGRIKGGIRLK